MLGSVLNGRYEIIEKVGIGGMAIVYKAKDIYLKRIVAVKVLKEQYLEDKEFIKKFVIVVSSTENWGSRTRFLSFLRKRQQHFCLQTAC